nr:immunoglobulin light chain junction region [Macaca mulatta]MOV66611.1 immunoglobulin light chain junction region [Macaca mulatta]MOV67529.1 immunoglobulin light chain junction region [Macaca mulatta]MOV67702.1 immunoglobulin light chain junction region [Macaca mulatta]MOV68435.1 immunoglobulin light chain junction region [Macaca mulatta]
DYYCSSYGGRNTLFF